MRSFYSLLALAALVLVAGPAAAQTALVQVVHNAADPAAAVVDIYIEEVSTIEPAIPAFAFREATPFIPLPAGTPLTVTVAPGGSTGAGDGLASFPFTLEDGETYQLIANGVLNPAAFAPNPNGVATGFTLFVNATGRTASTDPAQVQFNVLHGATDAPAVDVTARGVGTLVPGAAYGDLTAYLGAPVGNYLLDITPAGVPETLVATFRADLSGAAGAVSADGGASAPAAFAVEGLFPNPASASATVRFSLSADAEVGLAVFDVLGREVLRWRRRPWPRARSGRSP